MIGPGSDKNVSFTKFRMRSRNGEKPLAGSIAQKCASALEEDAMFITLVYFVTHLPMKAQRYFIIWIGRSAENIQIH